MKAKHYILAIFATLVLAGCYNDDKLWDAVNGKNSALKPSKAGRK